MGFARCEGARFKHALVLIWLLGVAPRFGQGTDAVPSGIIRDPSGEAIPGAVVTAQNLRAGSYRDAGRV